MKLKFFEMSDNTTANNLPFDIKSNNTFTTTTNSQQYMKMMGSKTIVLINSF